MSFGSPTFGRLNAKDVGIHLADEDISETQTRRLPQNNNPATATSW
jgi:hypothetical protein